jgi:hypothetical protein
VFPDERFALPDEGFVFPTERFAFPDEGFELRSYQFAVISPDRYRDQFELIAR